MNLSFTKQQLLRLSVASLGAVSLISLVHYLLATQPLTQQALVRQRQLLQSNQKQIAQWWSEEVNHVRDNLGDQDLISHSLLILQAKRHLRSDFETPLSRALRNNLRANAVNRNSVSLLTKGGIVVFSTSRQKLGMYQPLKNTTTSLELSELATTPLNFFTDSTTGLPSISIALPIDTRQKKRAGFLAIDLNLQRLNGLVSTDRADPGRHAEQKVPLQAYLAARTSLDRITTIAPPASLELKDAANFKFESLNSQGIHRALDGESGEGLYLNSRSQPVIGVYQYLPNFRTALLVESLQHDVYAPARQQSMLIFIIGLLLSLAPALGGLLLNHQTASQNDAK